MSLMLINWPNAIKERDRHDQTLLHLACNYSASGDVASLSLTNWPEAIKEKDICGLMPLHCACGFRA
eukprot:4980681-Ditylum_brightwellii.AAC.1